MAIVQIIIVGKNESANALNSTRKDVDLLDAAVGKLKNGLAALGISFSAVKLLDLAKDAAVMNARYTTLGVTMGVVGANAGYTADQMEKHEAALRKNGIAMIESRETLTKMASAHMELAESVKLSRIAQDAAVIGGINSSEAFSRMIDGIRSGEVEILKTIGINASFENSYKRLAKELGKTSDELTETEKVTARTNAVIAKGADIAGAYEAAMGTAGKQLSSMKRYMDNLKVTAGEVFQDLLIVAVGGFTDALKEANTEAERLQQEGQLKEWGRDVVLAMAAVADAVRIVINLVATVTGAAVAGTMQIFALGQATAAILRGDLAGARQSMNEMRAYGEGWWEDMQKRWNGKSFTASAQEMFAERDRNAPADAARKQEMEERQLAAGRERRREEEAQAQAAALEKEEKGWAKLAEWADESLEKMIAAEEKLLEEMRKRSNQYELLTAKMLEYEGEYQAAETQRQSVNKQSAEYLQLQTDAANGLRGAVGALATTEKQRSIDLATALSRENEEQRNYEESTARLREQLDVLLGKDKELADAEAKVREGLGAMAELQDRVRIAWAEGNKVAISALSQQIALQDRLNAKVSEQLAFMESVKVLTGEIVGFNNGQAIYRDDWKSQQYQYQSPQAAVAAAQGSPAASWGQPAGTIYDAQGKPVSVPAFAEGTPYVKKSGYAYIHEGEAVVKASQNRGGGGNITIGGISVTVQGGNSSAATVDEIARQLVPAIRRNLGRSLAA